MDIIPSYSFDQHEIIRWITKLHLSRRSIHLDPCIGNGNFYTPEDIPYPLLAFDIDADKVEHPGDCRNTALDDDSIVSIMFDPPFLQTTGKGSIIKDRFGSYPSMQELWKMYADSFKEFNRILIPGGVLVTKMQNTVMSGKQWWSVDYCNSALELLGFQKVDEFILIAKHRMTNIKKQIHARKHHSFFLVHKKGK